MNFDFKITMWERVTVPEKHEESVLQAIKDGQITSANDIYSFLSDGNNIECDKLYETDEQMDVLKNGGWETIEVADGDSILFDNGWDLAELRRKALLNLEEKDISAKEENDTIYVYVGDTELELSLFEIKFQADQWDENNE